MNHDPHEISERDDLPAAIRLQLRGLRAPIAPGQDLWPGIAERIANTAPALSLPPPATQGGKRFRSFAWLATAASVAVALAIGWQLHAPAVLAPADRDLAGTPLLVRQADAMDREYRAALRVVEAARPAAAPDHARAALDVLDRGLAETRAALQRDPSAFFLFEQLQRLQAQRLSLIRNLPASP